MTGRSEALTLLHTSMGAKRPQTLRVDATLHCASPRTEVCCIAVTLRRLLTAAANVWCSRGGRSDFGVSWCCRTQWYLLSNVGMQIFVFPRSHQLTHAHQRKVFAAAAVTAAYEPSTRMLALVFANPGDPDCRLQLSVFSGDYQKLSSCCDRRVAVPASQLLAVNGQLSGQLPCVLVPQSSSADAASEAKVSYYDTLVPPSPTCFLRYA
jgi:hypothetical protein